MFVRENILHCKKGIKQNHNKLMDTTFWPVNQCFLHCSLVEIIFLCILTSFILYTKIRRSRSIAKREKHTPKGVCKCFGATHKCWQTPKNWSTTGENMIFLNGGTFLFWIFPETIKPQQLCTSHCTPTINN